MTPRGIRNCNPLNIRRSAKDQWKGLAERQQDAAFCQFKSLVGGWPNERGRLSENPNLG